jgi:hypothetical protein
MDSLSPSWLQGLEIPHKHFFQGEKYLPCSTGLYGLPRRAGKLKDLSKFDASFFGVHPKQAHTMDPQLRLLLEVAYEAIVDGGGLWRLLVATWGPVGKEPVSRVLTVSRTWRDKGQDAAHWVLSLAPQKAIFFCANAKDIFFYDKDIFWH